MRRKFSKVMLALTVLLLGLVAAMGVGWLLAAIPSDDRPDPPWPVVGKSPPIETASIPWKRNAARPAKVPQPIAVGGMPWMASVNRPGEINLTAAAPLWPTVGAAAPVNLTAAALPWFPLPPQPPAGGVVIQPAVLPWPLDKK